MQSSAMKYREVNCSELHQIYFQIIFFSKYLSFLRIDTTVFTQAHVRLALKHVTKYLKATEKTGQAMQGIESFMYIDVHSYPIIGSVVKWKITNLIDILSPVKFI